MTIIKTPASDWVESLPEVVIEDLNLSGQELRRHEVLAAKGNLKELRTLAFNQTRGMKASPERNALYKEIQMHAEEEKSLQERIESDFVPQHGPSQFLSPRSFFQSALFSAANRSIERESTLIIPLAESNGKPYITYSGPELRQSDALVFLSILHMLRDIKVGTVVTFNAEAVCVALYGGYTGNTRRQLREHIRRLQSGLIITQEFTVQLCLGFEHPKFGPWSVALHPHIVDLFRISPEVWLSMEIWMSLPTGLSTWLYSYVQSQTRLIPKEISKLKELCGSDSEMRAFINSFRIAMRSLAAKGIIAPGWFLKMGMVHWKKP